MYEEGRLQATAPSALVRWCRVLLSLNGALWIVLAVGSALTDGSRGVEMPLPVLATLMLGNAAILFGLAYRLRGMGPSVLIAAPIWIAVNLALSFTDEVGLPDLIVGLLNLVTLVLLLTLGAVWFGRRRER